ncbi:MAG: Cupin protein [Devosia sp.]|uniref:cupin domain-containing protein n=1 Tax=Devosia sp. TaxID=1871048 RepID=UPI0026227E26|nr:cupin domain-containing protein [Devosia sp.]MDB5588981.1 Cupin protein [Devosia sp.]
MTERPDFIAHYSVHQRPLNDGGFADLGGLGSPLGRALGLTRIGIHYEIMPPGHRSSFPHAESHEEEFVLVLRGRPDVWIDGELFALEEGDAVGFPAGTGIAHAFLNNSSADVTLLIVGEANKAENRINYPLNPERMAQFAQDGRAWLDAPKRPLGAHDGVARAGARV